jgi:aspartyl protease family protein
MALSSGARGALGIAGKWIVGAVCIGIAGVVLAGKIDKLEDVVRGGATVSSKEAAGDESPAQSSRRDDRTVVLKADNRGHFITQLYINNRPIDVMVDTGATSVALTAEDARAAGVHVRDSDYRIPVSTANGTGYVAPVTLDSISIADIVVRDVQAVVLKPGQLNVTLLGMSFLKRLGRMEVRGRELVLAQ